MKISVIFLSTIALVLFLVSCSEDRSPAQSYATHIPGWMDTNSVDFHGQAVVRDTITYSGCRDCHAADSGDKEIRFCHQCHSAYPHRINTDSAASHQSVIRNYDWRLEECSNCHGATFAGGRTNVSCLGCHTSQGGPSNCNTCHGTPPIDDDTVPYGMEPGAAGGHQAMAVEKGYACTECHAPVTDLSHTGPLPADITFAPNSIARARGHASAPYDPSYQHVGEATSGNGTCAVYCHSNGNGGPPNQPVPEWTASFEFTCTSCHSIPPASPHPQVPTCHTCHSNVDPTSQYPNDIRFINEQLHVNGVVDL